MTASSDSKLKGAFTKLRIHSTVWVIAILFGLLAYGFIHGLIYAIESFEKLIF